MTMLLLTHQYQEVIFNTRGSTMRHLAQLELRMEHQFNVLLDMHQEMVLYHPQRDMLKQLSFQQHQVFSGVNNANIC